MEDTFHEGTTVRKKSSQAFYKAEHHVEFNLLGLPIFRFGTLPTSRLNHNITGEVRGLVPVRVLEVDPLSSDLSKQVLFI